MQDPAADLMDTASVPKGDFHGVEEGVVFVVPVHKGHCAGKELLQGGDVGVVILPPDIAGVAGDEQDVCLPQVVALGQTEKGAEGAVLVPGDQNSSVHVAAHTVSAFR